jgi:hypothetical protein
MPDTNQNPNLVIHTPQELADALTAQAQLERDIQQARATGTPTAESDLRLQSLRDAIAEHQLTPTPPAANPSPASDTNEIRLQSIRQDTLPPLPPPATNAPQNAPPPPANPSTNAPAAPNNSNLNQSTGTNSNTAGIDDSSLMQNVPGSSNSSPEVLIAPPNTIAPIPAANPSLPEAGMDFTPAVAAQTQSFQSAGDRMNAALEQNALITNSLFSRTLELLDLQNRRLGDVDRRINEIQGQMKSLKNP